MAWKLRCKLAVQGVWAVLRRPQYFVLAVVVSIAFVEFVYWFNNLPLLHYVLAVPTLSLITKLQCIFSTYGDLWQSAASPLAVSLLVLSIVQGCTLSVLVYAVKHQKAGMAGFRTISGSGVASIFATLGLGCAACGTSLLTPILVFIFSSSSVALADQVGFGVVVAGLGAGLYALYSAGKKAATVSAIHNNRQG